MFQDLINEALETGRPYIKEGEVATYIPELGRADKNKLGISIFCRDGSRFSCGDTKDRFSIQSISKVISLAVALEVCGFDMVFENVGWKRSGDAFNSLIKLGGIQQPSIQSDDQFRSNRSGRALLSRRYRLRRC